MLVRYNMKTPIDLTKLGDGYGLAPVSGPSHGPTVHFSTKGYELDFPEEGEMTVKFKMKRKEEMPQEERYECCLELTEIVKIKSSEPEAPARGEGEAGPALDALRDEMMGEEEED
jgi:hypothetical protein